MTLSPNPARQCARRWLRRGLRPRPEGDEQRRQVLLMVEQGLGSLPAGGKPLAGRFATQLVDGGTIPPE